MLNPARRPLERLEPRHLLAADALLSGTVWLDANQNSTWDLDEVGLAAVQVYLDLNGDGQLSIDEPATFTLADDPLTPEDETGYYEFANLEPGQYEVRVVLDNGLEQTFPHSIPEIEDLVVNGSFEESYEGWSNVAGADGRSWGPPLSTTSSTTCPTDGEVLFESVAAPDGTVFAAQSLFATNSPNVYLLYQDIDLTAVPTSTLSFQYRVQWRHDCALFSSSPVTTPNTFSVQIRDPLTDAVLDELELVAITGDEPRGDTNWQEVSLPLDDYFGQSVRIAFVGDVQSLNVRVNRVSLDAVQVLAPVAAATSASHTVVLGAGESQGALDFGIYSSQPLNTAPVLTGPGSVAVDEDDSLGLAGLLSLADADAAGQDLQVTLSVDVGELALAATDGLTVVSGTAGGDYQLVLQGSLTALNAAFDNLTFTPPEHFHGNAALNLVTSDLGNSGLGGAKWDELDVTIQVDPVNDPPQIDVPLEAVVVQEGTLSQTVDVSQLFRDIDVTTSGDLLAVDVTANTNDTLVTTSWLNGNLVLAIAPGLSGNAVLTLTATDLDGASAEFSLDVTVLATSRVSLNLARPEGLAEVGQSDASGSGSPATFHEWEDAAAELWITIQSDLPDGPLDIAWTAESTVPWIYDAEFIEHFGTSTSIFVFSHQNGTRFEGQILGVDLTGFSIGDRVLLATLLLPKYDEDPIGVPHNVEGAYASPTPESGLTLTEANILTTPQALAVDEAVPGHFLPVIFDADDNGAVGLSDFVQFVGSFGLPTDNESPKAFRFDYDRDGRVGLSDFSTFVRFFGTRKDSDHGIEIPDLLGPEASPAALVLEGEPMEGQLASEVVPMSENEALFLARFTEPRQAAAADESEETQVSTSVAPPELWENGETQDPVILDALWRDATWGWQDENFDDLVPVEDSLEPELSDLSVF